MKRRNFLAMALSLPLAGCGGGWQFGFGPVRGSGGSSSTSLDLLPSTGRVILPPGSALVLSQLTLRSGLDMAKLSTEGSFTLGQFDSNAALLTLTDNNGRPVLLGFSGSPTSSMVGEVSPLQTSVAMLFLALGAFTLPTSAHEHIRALLQSDERVKVLASQVTTILAANPYALADSDPALLNAVATVRDLLFPPPGRSATVPIRHRDEPLVSTLIQTTPESEVGGFFVGPNANGLGITITNSRRRNAIVSIYESAYTTTDPQNPIPIPYAGFHRLLFEQILWGTSGFAGTAGTIIDYAAGSYTDANGNVVGGAYVPVTAGPYNLDIYPTEATKSKYRVEVIANGNTSDPNNLTGTVLPGGNLTPVGAHLKICLITLFKDFVLPLIATVVGMPNSLRLDLLGDTPKGIPGTELFKAFDDLAVMFSGVIDTGIAISADNVRGAFLAIVKALGNNSTLRQKFIEWLVGVFAKQGFTSAVAGVVLGTLATALNAAVVLVDKLLGAVDLGLVIADWGRSESYLLFEATAIAGKVKISPNAGTITAGDSITLKASTTIDAPIITYRWKVTSSSGTLVNPVSGAQGTTLDSLTPELRYETKKSAVKETATIEVEGFVGSVNDPKRATIGKATSTLTVEPTTRVSITPASATISPGESLSLSATITGTYEGNVRYLWNLAGSNDTSLTDGSSPSGSSFESAKASVTLATGGSAKGTATVGVEAVAIASDGTRSSLGTTTASIAINDDIPFGQVRVVFDGKTRILPSYSTQRLSGTSGLALAALYQAVSTAYGGKVALKLTLQFATKTLSVGSTATVTSDYDLTYELPAGSNSLYFAPSAPGTLTVTEVGPGYFGYTLSVNLKGLRGVPTTGPATFKGWVTDY